MTGALDFIARQGTRFRRQVAVTEDGDTALDLTGYDIRMQVRRLPADDDTDVLLDLTLDDEITFEDDDPTTGVFVLFVGADVMADIPGSGEDGFVYDLELVPNGVEAEAFALLVGRFVVELEVTRDAS